MPAAVVSAKFPATKAVTRDMGKFRNLAETTLSADAAVGDTTVRLNSVAEVEADQWVATRGLNGYEILQVTTVDAVQVTFVGTRAQDGTTAVAHKQGQRVAGAIPAKALNQIVAEIVAMETHLGATGEAITWDRSLRLSPTSATQVPLILELHDESTVNKFISFEREIGGVRSEVGSINYDAANDQLEFQNIVLTVGAGASGLYENDRPLKFGTASNGEIVWNSALSRWEFNDTNIVVEQNISWLSGTAFLGTFDHANTANRTYTLPDATGNVVLGVSGTFTAGSVLFAGATGQVTQDNANLFWDDATNRLGIGTTSPQFGVEVRTSASQLGLTTSGTGQNADYTLGVQGAARWIVRKTSTTESGSSVGSDFAILARDDAGGALGTPVSISRSNGAVVLNAFGATGTIALQQQGATKLLVTTGGHVTAGADATSDIGSNAVGWKDAYLTGDLFWKSGTAFVGQFAHAITAGRTWTFPDATGTVGLLENTQTWTGTNTFQAANVNFTNNSGEVQLTGNTNTAGNGNFILTAIGSTSANLRARANQSILAFIDQDNTTANSAVFEIVRDASSQSGSWQRVASFQEIGAAQIFNTIAATTGIRLLNGPSAPTPTVTPQGTTGSTTWTYTIVALTNENEASSVASTAGTTATGNAVLDATNFNRLTWPVTSGIRQYRVYRTVAGGTPATTGLIATVDNVAVTGTSNVQYDDTGAAGDGASAPTLHTAGDIIPASNNVSALGYVGGLGGILGSTNRVMRLIATRTIQSDANVDITTSSTGNVTVSGLLRALAGTYAPVGTGSSQALAFNNPISTVAFATNPQTADVYTSNINVVTITNPSAGTVPNAASFRISGPVTAGANVTITNNHALWVDNGTSRFDGGVIIGDLAPSSSTVPSGDSLVHVHKSTDVNAGFHFTNSGTGSTSSDGFHMILEGTTYKMLFINRENAGMSFRTNNTEALLLTATQDAEFTQNVKWKSGTSFFGILDHANTAERTYTFPDASGTLTLALNGSATLDFPDTVGLGESDLTITVTGAATGDPVALGIPAAEAGSNRLFTAWVSAADTVTVRFRNLNTAGNQNPGSATYKVRVFK